MMKHLAVALMLCALAPAGAQLRLGLPDAPGTPVDAAGVLLEDWGPVAVTVDGAEWTAGVACDPTPTSERRATVGAVELLSRAWRAPAWPHSTDVLTVTAENRGTEPVMLPLRLDLPATVSLSGGVGSVGGRTVLRYDADTATPAEHRDWGYVAGGTPMPGWGHPAVACDPAFANIRAGMGGVPLEYRLAVRPGSSWNVAVGLMESHHTAPGQRPQIVRVEGEEPLVIDPIAVWGQHQPGVAMFVGRDLNADGLLRIEVLPVKGAPDVNPILNALWLFPREVEPDAREIVAGRLNDQAAAYVDVGGAGDQAFYVTEAVEYELALAPGATRELTFLLACRGGGLPESEAWTAAELRQSADDLWRDWFAGGAEVRLGDPAATAVYRTALAALVTERAQAGGYFAALPGGVGLEGYSPEAAAIVCAALDAAGQHLESRRLLRLYWDAPPEPLAGLAARSEGWGFVALARHALLTGDEAWGREAMPAAVETPGGEPQAEGPLVDLAREVLRVTAALATLDGETLVLLPAAEPAWFDGEGLSLTGLPTVYGPLSLTARSEGERVTVRLTPPTDRPCPAITLTAPKLDGRAPTVVLLNGRTATLTDGRLTVPPAQASTVVFGW